MLKSAVTAAILLACIVTAEARPRHKSGLDPSCGISMPCELPYASSPQAARETRGKFIARSMGFGAPVLKRAGRVQKARQTAIPGGAEIAGFNPVIDGKPLRRSVSSAELSGRPSNCPARAWCGCWLASHLGISDRSLWLAANWAHIGHSAGGPQVGAIVVWSHHVGTISAVDGNRILVLSGNDGRAVRERWRTTSGVIAYRLAGGW